MSAAGVRWDLAPLAASSEDFHRRLDALGDRADGFAALLDDGRAELGPLLAELAGVEDERALLEGFAYLSEAVDGDSGAARDLVVAYQRASSRAEAPHRSFTAWWQALPAGRTDALAAGIEDEAERRWLRSLRRFAPHRLEDAEERALAEREPLRAAWADLYESRLTALRVPFDDGSGEGELTLDEVETLADAPDRRLRLRAAAALYPAAAAEAPIVARCYDAVVADRLATDRLRGYRDPMAAANLENELPAAAVDAMLVAAESRYDLARRWLAAKARFLGIERLSVADQFASLAAEPEVPWAEARTAAVAAFARLAPELGRRAEAALAGGRVDAEPRPGKQPGGFAAAVGSRARPLVLVNYAGRLADSLVVVHELGHALHFELALERRSPLAAIAGVAVSEIPATLAELALADELLARLDGPARRALLARRLEGSLAAVLRQTVMTRFEQRAYDARATGSALTAERLGALWLEANEPYFGAGVERPPGWEASWALVPHFVLERFYTYAYTFAHLVALSLHARRRRDPAAFAEAYLELLGAGATASPAELLAAFGLDLDGGAWEEGLGELELQLGEAESALAG